MAEQLDHSYTSETFKRMLDCLRFRVCDNIRYCTSPCLCQCLGRKGIFIMRSCFIGGTVLCEQKQVQWLESWDQRFEVWYMLHSHLFLFMYLFFVRVGGEGGGGLSGWCFLHMGEDKEKQT